jgi:hypothetical protein
MHAKVLRIMSVSMPTFNIKSIGWLVEKRGNQFQVLHSSVDHIKSFWDSKGDSPPPDGLPPSLEELEHLLAHGLDGVSDPELEDKSHLGGE